MLKCEPTAIVFTDVRLNNAHVANVVLSNPSSSPMAFNIRPSNPRYTITPNYATLNAGQSIVITVRLFLQHFPDFEKGVRGVSDTIHFKSSYFDQKMDITFYLQDKSGRSRSVSPAARRSSSSGALGNMNYTNVLNSPTASSSPGRHGLNRSGSRDQNQWSHLKDEKISKLERLVRELEAKHPDIKEVVDAKLEEERQIFEEKSERVLEILRGKDEKIHELQEQLGRSAPNQPRGRVRSSSSGTPSRSSGKSSGSGSGNESSRSEDSLSNSAIYSTGTRGASAVAAMEQEMDALRGREVEQVERIELLLTENSLLKEQLKHPPPPPSGPSSSDKLTSSSSSFMYLQNSLKESNAELQRQKEKCNEFSQMNIELTQLNNKLQSSINTSQSENIRLKEQLGVTESELATCKHQHVELEEEISRLTAEQKLLQRRVQSSPSSGSEDVDVHDRWGKGGRYGTKAKTDHSAFSAFASPPRPSTTGSPPPVQETSSKLLSIYQEKLAHSEHIAAELRKIIDCTRCAEAEANNRFTEAQAKLDKFESEAALANSRYHGVEREKEQLGAKIEDLEVLLRRYKHVDKGSSSWGDIIDGQGGGEKEYAIHMDINDAHAWWGYVWHECRKEQRDDQKALEDIVMSSNITTGLVGGAATAQIGSSTVFNRLGEDDTRDRMEGLVSAGGGDGSGGGGNVDGSRSVEALQARVANQRESLRAQAVELASVRQMLLQHQLNSKYEVEKLKDQLATAQRENIQLVSTVRNQKNDKEIRINELTNTVRQLSSKGDTYALLVAARQELETERVTIHHLRADLEGYRTTVTLEQDKSSAMRKELLELQAKLDGINVMKTISAIPGVNASSVMELFSVQITSLRKELAVALAGGQTAENKAIKLQQALEQSQDEAQNWEKAALDGKKASGARSSPSKEKGVVGVAAVVDASDPVSSPAKGEPSDGRNASPWRRQYESVLKQHGLSGNLPKCPPPNVLSKLQEHREDAAGDVRSSTEFGRGMRSPLQVRQRSGDSGFSVLVDGYATPQTVIDSLGTATMAQRVQLQDQTVHILSDRLYALQAQLTSMEAVHAAEIQEVEKRTKVDLESAVKRRDLLEIAADEYKHEVHLLRERVCELEKTVLSNDFSMLDRRRGNGDNNTEILLLMNNAWRKSNGGQTNAGGSNSSVVRERQQDILGKQAAIFIDEYDDIDTEELDCTEDGYSVARGQVAGAVGGGNASGEEFDKVVAERNELRSLLRERSNQLKILTDTIDVLHEVGLGSDASGSADVNNFMSAGGDDTLESLAAQPMSSDSNPFNIGSGGGQAPSASVSSWGMKGLVKRIVELSADLAGATANAGTEGRRRNEAELDSRIKTKEIQKLRALLKTDRDRHADLGQRNQTAVDQLEQVEQKYAQMVFSLKEEKDEVVVALKDMEVALRDSQVQVEQLSQQLQSTLDDQTSERSEFQEWLDGVLLTSIDPPRAPGPPAVPIYPFETDSINSQRPQNKSNNDVKKLLNALLTQWKESVGYFPTPSTRKGSNDAASTSGMGSPNKETHSVSLVLTKDEQKYYQRIVDMVLQANDRANSAHQEVAEAQWQSEQSEVNSSVLKEKLKACLLQLHRYRKRTIASERVVATSQRSEAASYNQVVSHLRKTVASLQSQLSNRTDELSTERKNFLLCQIKYSASHQEIRKLQSQLATFETKGNSFIRAREHAVAATEARIRSAEDCLHKWFKTELPRLIAGLPISEEYMGVTADIYSAAAVNVGLGDSSDFLMSEKENRGGFASGLNSRRSTEAEMPSSKLITAMGMERTYALSHALCSSKAIQTAQDIKIASLQERNDILTEKIVGLEGIVYKWKQEILSSPIETSQQEAMLAKVKDSITIESDLEARYRKEVLQLEARVSELEEENIERKSKLSFANERNEELKQLVDQIVREEDDLKVKSSNQISKIRTELENTHAIELRNLRLAYESENHQLHDELLKVAAVLQDTAGGMGAHYIARDEDSSDYGELDEHGDPVRYSVSDDVRYSHPREKPANAGKPGHPQYTVPAISRPVAPSSPSAVNVNPIPSHEDTTQDDLGLEGATPRRTRTSQAIQITDAAQELRSIIEQRLQRRSGEDYYSQTPATVPLNEQLRAAGIVRPSESSHPNTPARGAVHPGHGAALHPVREGEVQGKLLSFMVDERPNPDGAGDNVSMNLNASQIYGDSDAGVLADRVRELEVLLDLEQKRNRNSNQEVNELTELLSIQHSVVNKHMDSASPAKNSDEKFTEKSAADAVGSDDESTASKEDTDLWPSLSGLVAELKGNLKNLLVRYEALAKDPMLRATVDMCSRMGAIVGSNRRVGHAKYVAPEPVAQPPRPSASTTSDATPAAEDTASATPSSTPLPASTTSGSASHSALLDELHALSSRVKTVEGDFEGENIPERHLYLLRDLRLRVSDIEKTVVKVMEAKEAAWRLEKNKMDIEYSRADSELEEFKAAHEKTIETIKGRYEEQLRQTQEALDTQTLDTSLQMKRLEELLSATLAKQAQPNQAGADRQNVVTANNTLADIIERQRTVSDSAAVGKSVPLAEYQRDREHLIKTHTDELTELKAKYAELNADQNDTINKLTAASPREVLPSEHTGKGARGANKGPSSDKNASSLLKTTTVELIEANGKIRELQYHYKTKSKQLDAVLQSIAHARKAYDPNDSDSLSVSDDGEATNASTNASIFLDDYSLMHSNSPRYRAATGAESAGGDEELHQFSFPDDFVYESLSAEEPRTAARDDTDISYPRSGGTGMPSRPPVPPLYTGDVHPDRQFRGSAGNSPSRQRRGVSTATTGGGVIDISSRAVNKMLAPSQPRAQPRPQAGAQAVPSETPAVMPQPNRDPAVLQRQQQTNLTSALRSSLLDARIAAADEEVGSMHKALQQEKRVNVDLRQQVQQLIAMQRDIRQTQFEQMHDEFDNVTTDRRERERDQSPGRAQNNGPWRGHSSSADEHHQRLMREHDKRLAAEQQRPPIDRHAAERHTHIPDPDIHTHYVLHQDDHHMEQDQASVSNMSQQSAISQQPVSINSHRSEIGHNDDPSDINDVDEVKEFVAPADASEKVKVMVKRMNQLRRHSKVELFRQKQEILNLKSVYAQVQDEVNVLRASNEENKEHAQMLREDNNRKSKLITQLKQAKNAEGKSAEQRHAEATELEEKNKRLVRNLNNKEILIKDLKTKIDTLQTQLQARATRDRSSRDIPTRGVRGALARENRDSARDIEHNPHSSGSGESGESSENTDGVSGVADMPAADSYYDANPHLSAQELRNRLRASELDRTRTRNKFKEYKDKISEYEKLYKTATEDVERYKKQASFVDSLRTSVTRKDAAVKSITRQLEKAVKENEELKVRAADTLAETEKRIK